MRIPAFSLLLALGLLTVFSVDVQANPSHSYIIVAAPDAQAVSGSVLSENGMPVASATVQVFMQGSSLVRFAAVTDADGRFEFESIPAGRYEALVSHVGYGSRSVAFSVDQEALTLDIVLREGVLTHEEVVVSSGRARVNLAPVAVSNISAIELAEQPDMKDLPVHLSRQPAITYHSENGNSIGYSTLRMRGFGQRRLAVAINGIPQNDPEEFNVFWINFFDIQGAVQDIQIQRGAGASNYGPTAIGGAINLRAMPYRPDFEAQVHVGGGSFGTRRLSAQVNSGLLNDRYVVFGRLSRLESDGYRDWSWAEFTRFFAGVTRYGDRSTLTLQAYGGPQRDGLAYSGIPKAANDGPVDDGFGGTIERTYNFSSFDRDTEDFHQPHVELHHDWTPSSRHTFSQTLFWVQGVGYFDFGGTFRSADYLRLPDGIVAPDQRSAPLFLSRPDISVLFRAYLDQWQIGWMPRLTIDRDASTTTFGLEARMHRSLRWGRVQESNLLPASIVGSDADARVYSFRGEKLIGSAYVTHLERVSDTWAVQGDAQLTWRRYRIHDEEFFGTEFDTPYVFLNPRIGVTWRPEQPVSAFGSIAIANREPRMKTHYDGEEAGSGFQPQFESTGNGGFDFDSPLVKPERVIDFELGASVTRERASLTGNLFLMLFQDEIVPSGGLDQFGVPRTGNAERTRHAGIELDGRVQVARSVALSGNVTFSRNRFVEFEEFVTAPDFSVVALDRSGNTIAGFPDLSGNVQADFRRGPWRAAIMASFVGEQFIDNGNGRNANGEVQDDLHVDPYVLVDANVAWTSRSKWPVSLSLDVNNVLDETVLMWGNVSVTGPQFFPAATRHVFLSAKIDLK